MHTAQRLPWQNFGQSLHSRTTPHSSPLRCFFVSYSRNNYSYVSIIHRYQDIHCDCPDMNVAVSPCDSRNMHNVLESLHLLNKIFMLQRLRGNPKGVYQIHQKAIYIYIYIYHSVPRQAAEMCIWSWSVHSSVVVVMKVLTWCQSALWQLTICCWSVHCYRNVVMNTTQSTHWMLSLRKFLRLA